MSKSSKKTYYAVHKGYNPGIYSTWKDCEKEIKKFIGAEFKKFDTKEDAEEFVKSGYGTIKPKSLTKKVNADKANNDKIEEECDDVPEDEKIYIYTDGSFIRGKPDIAGYGIYIPSKELRIALPLINQKITNNRAELTAIIESINYLDEDDLKKKICIFTDSQYSIYIMTGTGYRYAKNGYKDKSGKDVPNIDLIKKALILLKKYNIVLLKVRSHTNATDEHSRNNDIVDKLAIQGANKTKEHKDANSFSDILFYVDNDTKGDVLEDSLAYDSEEDETTTPPKAKELSTNFFKLSTKERDEDNEIEIERPDEVTESINNFKKECSKAYYNNEKNYINPSIKINELFDIETSDKKKNNTLSNKKKKLSDWFIII